MAVLARAWSWPAIVGSEETRAPGGARRFPVPVRAGGTAHRDRASLQVRAATPLLLAFLLAPWIGCGPAAGQELAVGSKKFTESFVLGEIATRALAEAGFPARHRQGMGGTKIVWEALRTGQISAYPEYTGTIAEAILQRKGRLSTRQIREALAPLGVRMTGELGFNNTYALVMRQERAAALGIRRISDLRGHPGLRAGVTHEFIKRQDGWEALAARYGLALPVQGVEHKLAYRALQAGRIDLTDAYSTDAEIAEHSLAVLDDDLGFFPQYKAVFLYRAELPAGAAAALERLAGTLPEARMIRLNAEAGRTKDYAAAAALYFGQTAGRSRLARPSVAVKIAGWTGQHLRLVGMSLSLAIVCGILLGIRAGRGDWLGQVILGSAGVIQTIPSLALLALLVPLAGFGISERTAVFALFLYSLLPIVRNTAAGLQDIPPSLRESAAALGLEPGAQLRKVFLPMASRTILAGIKTSAVINVGTATLAALIGAGGLGEPIIQGLDLNHPPTILQGAIPAALLAIGVQVLFEGLDRLIIPRGLRLGAGDRAQRAGW